MRNLIIALAVLALSVGVAWADGVTWTNVPLVFNQNIGSTAATSSGQVTSAYAESDTTGWIYIGNYTLPRKQGAVTDSVIANGPYLLFKFTFGGSTADTNLVTVQACQDPSSTITTKHVLSVVGHAPAWGYSAGIHANHKLLYWRAIFKHNDGSTSASSYTVRGNLSVLEAK